MEEDPLARGDEDMEGGGRPPKRRKVESGMTNLQNLQRRRVTGPRGSQAPHVHRQWGLLPSRRDTMGGISFSKRWSCRIFRFVRTRTGNVSPSLQKRADRQRTAIQVQHSSSSTWGRRHLWTLLRWLRQIQIYELYSGRYHEWILRPRPKDDRGRIERHLRMNFVYDIYIVNKKNWIIIFVIVDALNHSSLSAPTQYSPMFHF